MWTRHPARRDVEGVAIGGFKEVRAFHLHDSQIRREVVPENGCCEGGTSAIQRDVAHAKIGSVEDPLFYTLGIHAEDTADVFGLERIK